MNWAELAAESHYKTAIAVGHAVAEGNYPDARRGLEELIDALSRADRRALKSHLIRLMSHVIKWLSQPDRRSRSWRATIRNARREIADSQVETPSLTRETIEEMWDDCFAAALDEATGEMNQESEVARLTWAQVFEDEYEIPSAPGKGSKRKR